MLAVLSKFFIVCFTQWTAYAKNVFKVDIREFPNDIYSLKNSFWTKCFHVDIWSQALLYMCTNGVVQFTPLPCLCFNTVFCVSYPSYFISLTTSSYPTTLLLKSQINHTITCKISETFIRLSLWPIYYIYKYW